MGLSVLTQDSRGKLDAHGLAPERFTDQRARRPMVAANFESDAGRIRFSGPSHEVPWQPGVQDRLSWMVQLAAIAQARPDAVRRDARVSMWVSGARGDADVWTFVSMGPESLELDAGPVPAIRLLREPRQRHDTRVEVWLDPARQYLPARLKLTSGRDDDALDFVRRP